MGKVSENVRPFRRGILLQEIHDAPTNFGDKSLAISLGAIGRIGSQAFPLFHGHVMPLNEPVPLAGFTLADLLPTPTSAERFILD